MSITSEALTEAIDIMENMTINEGQKTVLHKYIIPNFIKTHEELKEEPCYGWDDVDAGDYIDFMGEICEAGNLIMTDAYNYACIIEQAQEIVEFIE